MPGPAPNVPYTPFPTTAPDTITRPRYIDSRANPDDFGANVGGALERSGGQVANDFAGVALQRQGMMNETMATNAETDYIKQLSAVTGKYNSLEGLSAVAATDSTKAQIAALRQQVLSTLPNPQSQRAFNMLAQRHEANAFADIERYSAAQHKVADNNSAQASLTTAIGQAGDINVASDDRRFNAQLQTADFQIVRQLNNQGYGPDAGTGMRQDPKTGEVTFDESTEAGRMAAAKYREMRDQAYGQAWELRLKTLSDSNLLTAYQTYQNNRGSIPGAVQAKLDAFFQPKIRDAQTRDIADGTLSHFANGWTGKPQNVDDQLPTFRLLEGSADDAVSPAGAIGRYQIMPATAKNLGFDPDKLKDPEYNTQAARAVLTYLNAKYPGDPEAVAVAYNAGENRANQWLAANRNNAVLPQETQRYLQHLGELGVKAQPVQPGGIGQPLYQSQADYFGAHYDEIVQATRAAADQAHPDDPHFADAAQARVEQRMNNLITQQRQQYEADNRMLIQAFNGDFSKGARPTSVEQMIATNPAVKDAWDRLQITNPMAAEHIQNQILTANAKANKGEAGFDAPGYEGTWRQIQDKIWSTDPNDPNRITDPSQVYQFRDRLTQAGFDKAIEQIDKTPAHPQILQMQKDALAAAEAKIVNPLDMPGLGKLEDPALRRRFDVGFVPAFYAAYDAAINDPKNPKTPWQLLGEGPDNLVDKLMPKFQPSPEESAAATVNAKPADDRNIWQRNAPDFLGGKDVLGSRGNPVIPKTQADIIGAAPGTFIRAPDGRLLMKPYPIQQPGAPAAPQ